MLLAWSEMSINIVIIDYYFDRLCKSITTSIYLQLFLLTLSMLWFSPARYAHVSTSRQVKIIMNVNGHLIKVSKKDG